MRTVAGDILNYTYDSLQRRTDKYITGKVWERYTYDDARVATKKNWMGNTLTHDFAYTYDTLGNIMTETENNTDITFSYTYDRMGQLTGAVRKDGEGNTLRTESYTYDNAGNILTFNTGYKSLTFGYGNGQWKDQLTSVTKDGNAHTITYDAAGNPLTYYNGYSLNHYMTWTEGRRLETYLYNGKTYAYEYNADGLRTKKTNPDGTYIEYLIADGRYLGEIHYTASNVIDLYIRYNYDESGSVIGISLWNEQGGTAWEHYYFVKSLQGDVLQIYRGSDSTPVASYSYDSWGNVTASGSATFDGRAIKDLNPFRYRGYYFDNESWFYYLQSRYYDPAIGRFISADVLASTGQGILGHNMYAYCGNNPVMRVDDGGEFWHIIAGAVVGAAVSFVSSVVTDVVAGRDIDWAGAGISAAFGALDGALSSTGLCPGIQIAGGAAIAGAENYVQQGVEKGFDEVCYSDVAINAVVGGVCSINNGTSKATAKHLHKQGINATNRVIDSLKYNGISAVAETVKAATKYYYSQTAELFYKPLMANAGRDLVSAIGKGMFFNTVLTAS